MASENNLWQCVRPRLTSAGVFYQRIETSTGEGVPDLWLGTSTGYAWAELKAVPAWPVRASTRVFGSKGLSKEQIVWHLKAAKNGVRAFIFAGVGVGAKRQTFLVPGSHCEAFNDLNKAELTEFALDIDDVPLIPYLPT